jgi:hypothetical protein
VLWWSDELFKKEREKKLMKKLGETVEKVEGQLLKRESNKVFKSKRGKLLKR